MHQPTTILFFALTHTTSRDSIPTSSNTVYIIFTHTRVSLYKTMDTQQTFQTTSYLSPPYKVFVDATHLTQVPKGGEHIGIYALTPTGKKRGILLPVDTWYALERYRNLINVSIDLATGKLTPASVTETIYPQQYYQQQHQDNLDEINSLYQNGAQKSNQTNAAAMPRYQSYTIQPPPYPYQQQQQQQQQPKHEPECTFQQYQQPKPEPECTFQQPKSEPESTCEPTKQHNQSYSHELFQKPESSQTFPILEYFSDNVLMETCDTASGS